MRTFEILVCRKCRAARTVYLGERPLICTHCATAADWHVPQSTDLTKEDRVFLWAIGIAPDG